MKGRKLGRGLDILLDRARKSPQPESAEASTPESAPEATAPAPAEAARDEIREIPVSALSPNPQQPRISFDRQELDTLVQSIKREGVLQPVLVRRTEDGHQLVAGERRLRAAQELGLKTIPTIEVAVKDERLLEIALIENIHRENLNPIDLAKAFQSLIELKGWTQDALAKNLGLARPTVSNTVRLLELPENIQGAVVRGQIQMGHAKILLSIEAVEEQQELFEKIAEDRLTVRELEVERDVLPPPAPGDAPRKATPRRRKRANPKKSARVLELEEELSRKLSTRVTITESKGKGKGVIQLEFYSPEDFEHLRSLLLSDNTEIE